jgi:hypothetical protein
MPNAEDTRLIWAGLHLHRAVSLAREGSRLEATRELGYGLHSLQDAFAHGQATPFMHVVLGRKFDDVNYNPLATYEASMATRAYLKEFLRLASGDPSNSLANLV